MAGEKRTEGKSLENIEAELDRMESGEAGGERQQPFVGAGDDDIDVVFATEGNEEGIDPDPKPAADPAPGAEAAGAEGDDPGTAAAGEGGEEELSGYSKGIRQRIQRETEKRRSAEAREEAERTARVQAENRAQSAEFAQAELTLKALDTELAAAEEKLKKAKTDGKVDDEVAAQRKMGELQSQRHDVERAKEQIKNMKRVEPNALAVQWQQKNRWFNKPEFAPESAMLRQISAELATKFPTNSPEHFDEINKELRRRMPNLGARVRATLGANSIEWEEAKRPGNGNARPANGGAARLGAPSGGFGRPANPGNKRQVVLTKADTDNMRRVRLDPENKQHVLEYARNKSRLSQN